MIANKCTNTQLFNLALNNPQELELPEPQSPKELVDVGNCCAECGRNIGIFPVSKICQYCRSYKQKNGNVIVGIAKHTGCEWVRVANNLLEVNADGTVEFTKGRYSDVEWTCGKPTLQNNNTIFINDGTMFWVKFKDA